MKIRMYRNMIDGLKITTIMQYLMLLIQYRIADGLDRWIHLCWLAMIKE